MEWLRQVIERNRGSGEEITLSQGSSSHHLVPSPSSLFSHTVLHEQRRAGELFAPSEEWLGAPEGFFPARSQWEMSERCATCIRRGKTSALGRSSTVRSDRRGHLKLGLAESPSAQRRKKRVGDLTDA